MRVVGAVLGAAIIGLCVKGAGAFETNLRDRGEGVSLSMFGTYICKGEVIVYPFFEYYLDDNAEYSPQELGFGLDRDFRGRYRASEGLIFLGYGVTENVALEMEAAIITAELETAPDDPTGTPERIKESGLGDVEGQVRWRWLRESRKRPEIFSYFETVFPLQKDKVLIGTSDWEFKLGTGFIRGYSFGTITLRAAVEYDRSEDLFELGEVALEYIRRPSPRWLLYLGIEGTQDEIELIPEVQIGIGRGAFLVLNSGIGLSSKATDWAPETGLMLRF